MGKNMHTHNYPVFIFNVTIAYGPNIFVFLHFFPLDTQPLFSKPQKTKVRTPHSENVQFGLSPPPPCHVALGVAKFYEWMSGRCVKFEIALTLAHAVQGNFKMAPRVKELGGSDENGPEKKIGLKFGCRPKIKPLLNLLHNKCCRLVKIADEGHEMIRTMFCGLTRPRLFFF